MWPDRTPHPAAFELKHLQAPLGIALALPAGAAAAAGTETTAAAAPQPPAAEQEVRLRLRSKQFFATSGGLALRWRLVADGCPVPAPAAAAGKGGGTAGDGSWQPLVLAQPLAPQQDAAVGLGVSWGQLGAAAAGAAEACLEVQVQVRAAAGRVRLSRTWLSRSLPCANLQSRGRERRQAS